MSDVRELPKNIESEQYVLGAGILEPEESMPLLVEALKPENFYDRRHRVIFRAMLGLYRDNKPNDVVSIAGRLEERDEMERAGSRMYLNELVDRVQTTASLEHYTEIVRDKAKLRAMIEAGGRITELGYDETQPPDELLDKAEAMVFDISTNALLTSYAPIGQGIYGHLEEIEKRHTHGGLAGLSSGFAKLDEMTTGFNPEELWILAARPGVGKSSLLIALARHMTLHDGKRVGMFSLEMSEKNLRERLLAAEAHVSLLKLRAGMLDAAGMREVVHGASKIEKAELIVDDTPGLTVLEIRARARRMHMQYGLDAIMIDYLQRISPSGRYGTRQEEVADMAQGMKNLSRELKLPVIAAAQLNRTIDDRPDNRPRLSDLRESGAIEQEADAVVFIHRPDYYEHDQEKLAPTSDTELVVAKQRNGPTGIVKARFHRTYAAFYPGTVN